MVERGQVIAYRAAMHGLAVGGANACGPMLATGVQDHPTGTTARLALGLRGHAVSDTALVHSVRAATHLHHPADLGLLAAALRIENGRDLAKPGIGPFAAEIGSRFGAAMDHVASAMTAVMADGHPRAKGELSSAVTPRVDARVAPWCGGCGVHHVQDVLFRYATLQAGLAIQVESPRMFRFLPPVPFRRPGTGAARAEMVRRFLHLAGPAKPAQLAGWLALTPEAARRWWSQIEDELAEVSVDGRRAWLHRDDAALLAEPPAADPVRLLGPYDPLTELADRELMVPAAGARQRVWAAAANPGIVVVDGEIAGVWRRRTARQRLTVSVTPFGSLPRQWAEHVSADAATIARFAGAADVDVQLAEDGASGVRPVS